MRASGRGGGRTLYDARVNHVVLVPVKAFADAKARLATVLSPGEREALARWTAERVLAAAGELPVYIARDSEAVAEWATAHGATVLWHPGVGLNAAVNRSVADLRRQGVDHVVVAHGDLPRAAALAAVVIPGALTLVPDARGDGTNVIALPLHLLFEFEYGPGSFRRHLQRGGERLAGGRASRSDAGNRHRHTIRPHAPAGAGSAARMAANEPGQPDPSPSLISHDLPTPTSALAIGAHPDDVEFGCGATLAKWAAAGCLVHHLVLTDGSKGTWNAPADVAALIATRRHEQRAAARLLAGERRRGGLPR